MENNINYYNIVKDSHYYDKLEQILMDVKELNKYYTPIPQVKVTNNLHEFYIQTPLVMFDDVIKGIENTISNGYELHKQNTIMNDIMLRKRTLEAQIKLCESEIYKLQIKPREGKEL